MTIRAAYRRLKQFGGASFPGKENDAKRHKRAAANSDFFKHLKFGLATVGAEKLRLWKLKDVLLVNNDAHARKHISLDQYDTLRLKYKLAEVSELKEERYWTFISGLGCIYLR